VNKSLSKVLTRCQTALIKNYLELCSVKLCAWCWNIYLCKATDSKKSSNSHRRIRAQSKTRKRLIHRAKPISLCLHACKMFRFTRRQWRSHNVIANFAFHTTPDISTPAFLSLQSGAHRSTPAFSTSVNSASPITEALIEQGCKSINVVVLGDDDIPLTASIIFLPVDVA